VTIPLGEREIVTTATGLEVREPGRTVQVATRDELVEGLLGRRPDFTRPEAERYVDRYLVGGLR
jgi:hypothetical protein